LNKATATMLTDQIISVIEQDNFWYKQIVQAAICVNNFEIFSQIYSAKKLVEFNLSNVGTEILHLIAPTLSHRQIVYLAKKFICERSLVKIRILMNHWDTSVLTIPDTIWSKLLKNPHIEIFEYLMCKINYEYPKYLFDHHTDFFLSQWIDFIPEKYVGEINQFVSKSICKNKISYLKIVLPKCKKWTNIFIQPNELASQKVNLDTFSYVISTGLVDLTDLDTFDKLIFRIILSESVNVLKPLLSNKKILDHIRMIRGVEFLNMKFLPLEMPSLVNSIAALPIQYKKIKIFNLFMSKDVYSPHKEFWLEYALVKDAPKIFNSILKKCSQCDIMESNYRIIYIAASNPKYLIQVLDKFNKFDNFDPELFSTLFYRELYSNINKLNDKIKSAIPSTYNHLYIANVLLNSSTTKNEFNKIVNEHKELVESNLDSILDELIKLNLDLCVMHLIELFSDPSLYKETYSHLVHYLSSNIRPNLLFIILCDFFSSRIDIRVDSDYLFSQLFPRCKHKLIYDYFVNKFPYTYSYFINRNYQVIGIKIGSRIIGNTTDGFVGSGTIKLSCVEPCSICYGENSNVITKCSHQYCLTCLTKWYNQNKDTCPVCRQEYYPVSKIELD